MKKKAISLLLVAAMTATMTAGCGDKQEAADNTTAGNDAAPSTEAAASDDAATEEEEEASFPAVVLSAAHRKIRIQAGYRKNVTHSMRLIQTGMSHLSMVYVQRVMQKLLSQQTLRDLQMSICWHTITSLME